MSHEDFELIDLPFGFDEENAPKLLKSVETLLYSFENLAR